MINDLKECKILKVIRSNGNKRVSIIEYNNKKYILKEAMSYNLETVNMLKNEVNVFYLLKENNCIPSLLTYKFDNNDNYIIADLVKGKRINELKQLDFRSKVLLIIEIINALIEIHSKGIVHCDLKPSNIILGLDKKIHIIDFDISVWENKQYFANYGSVAYCSLQQIMKQNIDFNTDLYSLGVIFYEIILGKLPFNGTKEEIIDKKKKCVFEYCDDDLLNFIFYKLFTTNNDIKYKNLLEFKRDLKALLFIKK